MSYFRGHFFLICSDSPFFRGSHSSSFSDNAARHYNLWQNKWLAIQQMSLLYCWAHGQPSCTQTVFHSMHVAKFWLMKYESGPSENLLHTGPVSHPLSVGWILMLLVTLEAASWKWQDLSEPVCLRMFSWWDFKWLKDKLLLCQAPETPRVCCYIS